METIDVIGVGPFNEKSFEFHLVTLLQKLRSIQKKKGRIISNTCKTLFTLRWWKQSYTQVPTETNLYKSILFLQG